MCLHLSFHPFLFSPPLHTCNLFLSHTAIYYKSFSFLFFHSLVPTMSACLLFLLVHTLSIPNLPLILPPLFLPPTYTFMIQSGFLLWLTLCSEDSHLPSLTQGITRKGSINLDTLVKTLLLDLHGLSSSHSSVHCISGSCTLTPVSIHLLITICSSHVPPTLTIVPFSSSFSQLPLPSCGTGVFSCTQGHTII